MLAVLLVCSIIMPMPACCCGMSSCYGEAVEGIDVSVHKVYVYFNARPSRVFQMREETDKDTSLSALHEVIMQRWPEKTLQ